MLLKGAVTMFPRAFSTAVLMKDPIFYHNLHPYNLLGGLEGPRMQSPTTTRNSLSSLPLRGG
jgi:hypothetical protein